jgi:hypothetical protein
MMRQLLRAYVLRRLLGSGRSHRPTYRYGRRPHRRTGFYGPFPYHTRRTRRGSRVTVTGCCLPIPLGVLAALAAAVRLLLRA